MYVRVCVCMCVYIRCLNVHKIEDKIVEVWGGWGEHILNITNNKYVLVAQSSPILWDPMEGNPPGSSLHGILQARILEWVTIPFSRGSSQPRDQTQVSCTASRFFTI